MIDTSSSVVSTVPLLPKVKMVDRFFKATLEEKKLMKKSRKKQLQSQEEKVCSSESKIIQLFIFKWVGAGKEGLGDYQECAS